MQQSTSDVLLNADSLLLNTINTRHDTYHLTLGGVMTNLHKFVTNDNINEAKIYSKQVCDWLARAYDTLVQPLIQSTMHIPSYEHAYRQVCKYVLCFVSSISLLCIG
jgi:hypothetical protein